MGGGTIKTSADQLGSLQLQQSAYGLPVAIVYGRNRVPVNLVYYDDFTAVARTETQSSGGKGGAPEVQNTTYTYTAAVILSVCEGEIAGIGAVYRDKEVLTLTSSGLSLRQGSEAQSVWPFLTANHPDKAVGYSGTAYLYAQAYSLQSNASLGNHNVEVKTTWEYGGAIFDANAADFIPDFLTHPRYGLGLAPAQLANLTDYSNYIRAAGLFLSPACTEQREGHEYLTEWAALTNSELVWSGTQLRFVPYGDTTISGNGATYVPDLAPIYELDDDDFLATGDGDPLRIRRGDSVDSYNVRSLEFNDRANAYNKSVVTASDQASIDQFGIRRADKISTSAVCDAGVASRTLQLRLQRDVYVRNFYDFSLGAWAQLLEPMDRLTLTDTRLGLDRWPVRIREISEQDDGSIDVVAEDAPAGLGHSPLYTRGTGAGYQPNTLVDPGDVAVPLIFEPPAQLSDDRLQVWVAVTGQINAWGGCSMWVSTDGDTYQKMGTVSGGARYGVLTAALTDAGSSMDVELVGKGGQMLSGTALDASLLNTLCAVDTEFLAYQDATLTGPNAYTLSGLVRGAYESGAVAHIDGAPFVRLDDAIAKSQTLSPAFIGETLYFKFTSFNVFGLAEQSLDDVTAYGYEVTGQFYLAAPNGLTGVQLQIDTASNQAIFSWDAITDPYLLSGGSVVIRYTSEDLSTADWNDAVEIGRFPATAVSGTVGLLVGSYLLRTSRSIDGIEVYSAGIVGIYNDQGGAGGSLSATISPDPLYKTGPGTSVSGQLTAAVSGATGAVTYAWSQVSGDTVAISPTDQAVVTVTASGLSAGDRAIALVQCLVTDTLGNVTPTAGVNLGRSQASGNPNCVSVDSLLPDGRRAGDVCIGDLMSLTDPWSGTRCHGEVTFSQMVSAPCVRIRTADASLVCSMTAPIPCADGVYREAPELLGHSVPVMSAEGELYWQAVIRIEDLGMRQVQHLTVGDRCFWAGESAGAYILHHNAKLIP